MTGDNTQTNDTAKTSRGRLWPLFSRKRSLVIAVCLFLTALGVGGFLYTRDKDPSPGPEQQLEANSNERQVRLNQENVQNAGTTEEKIEALLGLAADYNLVNDQEGSIAAYEQVLELDPNNETALGSLAYIYYGRKDAQNAEKYLTKVIEVIGSPTDPRILDNLNIYKTMLKNVQNGSFAPYESQEVL